MTETEKLKEQIKVLQSKLSFLEESKKTKSPMEEAYNEWYGEYPPTSPDADKRDIARWHGFQAGYNAAYEEKVAQPEEGHKTLHQMFCDRGWSEWSDELCDIVEKWILQYDCDYGVCKGYLEGY